ncbi:unnamed protein product, partial [Linum tenue]
FRFWVINLQDYFQADNQEQDDRGILRRPLRDDAPQLPALGLVRAAFRLQGQPPRHHHQRHRRRHRDRLRPSLPRLRPQEGESQDRQPVRRRALRLRRHRTRLLVRAPRQHPQALLWHCRHRLLHHHVRFPSFHHGKFLIN